MRAARGHSSPNNGAHIFATTNMINLQATSHKHDNNINNNKANHLEEDDEFPLIATKHDESPSNDETKASRSRKKHKNPLSSQYEICDTLLGNKIDDPFYYLCEPFIPSKSATTTGNTAVANDNNDNNDDAGHIQCQWNPVLLTSFCEARNILIDPSKITVSRGGEPLQDVLGRNESIEFPFYQPGAFQLSQCKLHNDTKQLTVPLSLPHDNNKNNLAFQNLLPFHLHTMMKHVRTQPSLGCASYEERPTLLVTRYEYCNTYHTFTDYYITYQALLVALMGQTAPGQENEQDEEWDSTTIIKDITERDLRIIFMDGHAAGSLDEGWQILFPNAEISYVSALQQPSHHPACFRHAIFVPPGYRSPLSITAMEDGRVVPTPAGYISKCGETNWHASFRDAMIEHARTYQASSSSSSRQQISNPPASVNRNESPVSLLQQTPPTGLASHDEGDALLPELKVVLLSRQDYYAHPRMEGTVTRKIKNEDELLSAMYKQQNESKYDFTMNVKKVVLEEYNFAQQVLLMHDADIIIGMHGAGLSHIFLTQPGTVLVELKPPGFIIQEHFRYLSKFAGAIHKPHILRGLSNKPSDLTIPYELLVDDFQEAFQTGINTYFYYQILANEVIAR